MIFLIDFWDTAGQEKFQSMHPSYYHQAHACILVFDATRKNTYKNLANWYAEMRKYRPSIPCISAVNKIDGEYPIPWFSNLWIFQRDFQFFEFFLYLTQLFLTTHQTLLSENPEITSKSFAFCTKNDIPLHYVSASDGTNVVKLFNEAIEKAVEYKKNPVDIEDQILEELENFDDFWTIALFIFIHNFTLSLCFCQ